MNNRNKIYQSCNVMCTDSKGQNSTAQEQALQPTKPAPIMLSYLDLLPIFLYSPSVHVSIQMSLKCR